MKHIALIGFMGCGKSSTGKAFAAAAGLPLFDTDTAIEQLHGQSISDIFATQGEEAFRTCEHQIIAALLNSPTPSIIVCGGGTPCFHNTLPLLCQKATTVYLRAPAEWLCQRLCNHTDKRPLLQNKPDLLQYITTLLALREPVYRQAQHTIDVAEKSTPEIVRILLDTCL